MNAYYLSEPQRYDNHAKNVVLEDSLVQVDEADKVIYLIQYYHFDRYYISGLNLEIYYDLKKTHT